MNNWKKQPKLLGVVGPDGLRISASPVKETLFLKQNCSFHHLTILDYRRKLGVKNLTSKKKKTSKDHKTLFFF